VLLKTSAAVDEDGEMRLTMRIGDRVKRVSLVADYPEALGRLPELVDHVGGPNVWVGR